MKKHILFALSMMLLGITIQAQSTSKDPFAGKTFRIDNYLNDHFENSEDLIFANGEVEGSMCVLYGFSLVNYTAKLNDRNLWEFSCTMTSEQHGKMVWQGELLGEKISGRYLWTKEGQDPLEFTFKGESKDDK